MWSFVAAAAVLAGQKLAILAQPLIAALARPNIGGPIALAGAIALGSGIGRYRGAGIDGETLITLGIGIVLLIAALPLLSSLTGIRMPNLPALGISPRIAGIAAAIVVAAAGVAWFASGTKTNLASLTGQLPLVGGAKPLQGRAEALSGDLLRVAGTTVRLAGIEAPERQQTCGAGGRRYQCGAAAQAALGRLVNGRALSCTLSGTDPAGRPLATLHAGRDPGHQWRAGAPRPCVRRERSVWQLLRPRARGAHRQGRDVGRRRGRAPRGVPRQSCGRKPSAAPPTAARSKAW